MDLVHYFGVIVRSGTGWSVLDDAGHAPLGLTAASLGPNGTLQIDFPALAKVGTFTITPDEAWCGKFIPGASVGLDVAYVTIRTPNGTLVPANSSLLVGGNWWVDLWGWVEASGV